MWGFGLGRLVPKCGNRQLSSNSFYGRSNISAQHTNSLNPGPKTRFSCVRRRTRKLRRSISSRKGLRKLMFSESPAMRSLRSLCAEADPEIQPKSLRGSSSGRRKPKRLQALLAEGSRKGFAEGVVFVVELYSNKNYSSTGLYHFCWALYCY